jgi:hypothetical protein
MTTPVSESWPPSLRRPRPPAMVRPESASDPPRTSNARPRPPPRMVSSFALGPAIMVVAVSVSVSRPPLRVMVCGASNRLEKAIVSA